MHPVASCAAAAHRVRLRLTVKRLFRVCDLVHRARCPTRPRTPTNSATRTLNLTLALYVLCIIGERG